MRACRLLLTLSQWGVGRRVPAACAPTSVTTRQMALAMTAAPGFSTMPAHWAQTAATAGRVATPQLLRPRHLSWQAAQ
jgi:hypothetical protein